MRSGAFVLYAVMENVRVYWILLASKARSFVLAR